jgi:hypothetical protein
MRKALVILLLLATAAGAQPRDPRGPAPVLSADRREAIKKRIRVMRAATLTDELNLDEKALSRLLPVLSKWDDVTEDLLRKRVDLQRRLTAPDAAKDPRALDRVIDEAVANQKAFWDLEDKRLAELRRILTPAQIARLLIVLPAFERKIQNQLRRAINRRGGAGSGAGAAEDDDIEPDEAPAPRRR